MTETTARRRGHGEDGICFATAKNRWAGSVSLGYGPDEKRIRRKVFGKTKQDVRDRLKAKALLATAERTRWHAYVALSMLAGIRTEEARALRWDHVVTRIDEATGWQPVTTAGFDAARSGDIRYAIYVRRSERYGGDTKAEKSRRTLALPQRCVEALRQHRDSHEVSQWSCARCVRLGRLGMVGSGAPADLAGDRLSRRGPGMRHQPETVRFRASGEWQRTPSRRRLRIAV
jgi:integrase